MPPARRRSCRTPRRRVPSGAASALSSAPSQGSAGTRRARERSVARRGGAFATGVLPTTCVSPHTRHAPRSEAIPRSERHAVRLQRLRLEIGIGADAIEASTRMTSSVSALARESMSVVHERCHVPTASHAFFRRCRGAEARRRAVALVRKRQAIPPQLAAGFLRYRPARGPSDT
jgi:hypothetical protein